MEFRCLQLLVALALTACSVQSLAADAVDTKVVSPLFERFASVNGEAPANTETPSFQKHVTPLLGRLGCNGRACHGSFQGQGGFRLSLFGYDFKADFDALITEDAGRVNLQEKLDSLILTKPVSDEDHEGGKRFEKNGWEYWVLRRWIEAGAPYEAKSIQTLRELEVTPKEMNFTNAGQEQQLRAIAHWEDGTSEDVTCLCRFQSNDSVIASVSESGKITAGEAGDTHIVVSYDNAVVPVLVLRPVSDQFGEKYPQVAARTQVDNLILQKLRKLGIVPSEICTDEEFLRRASLDVSGTLPTSREVTEFVNDRNPDKRQQKIEELLQRPGYAAQWATFLCDITGNNDEQLRNYFPQTVQLSDQWYQWIYKRVAENAPYDQIVEGLLTSTSRMPGESYREYCEAMTEACKDRTGEKFADRPTMVYYWARNNFRTTEERAIGFAYTFLGVRIQCAQCHKHPFDQWAKSDFDNFERLFSGFQANQNSLSPDGKREYTKIVEDLGIDKSLKGNNLRKAIGDMLREDKSGKVFPFPEMIVGENRDKNKDKNRKDKKGPPPVPKAKLLGGEWVELDSSDVRGKLMDWLRSPENPYFAKAITNRIWAAYFGAGIVNPPDDLNLANAPSNAPLLDYLAQGLQENNFDLKWLHRQILNSDAYQRSWIKNATNEHDKRNFSRSMLRRLPAEATYDAVRMALLNDQQANDVQNLRLSRALTRGGSSAQAPRDDMSYALTVFGRSSRESNCDCDRSSEPSLLQTVYLVNDKSIQTWLTDREVGWVAQMAQKYGWQVNKGQQGDRKMSEEAIQRAHRQIEQLQTQLTQAKSKKAEAEKNQQAERIESLAQRQRQLEKQIRKMRDAIGETAEQPSLEPIAETKSTSQMTQEQALEVAEEAYLRSLSRKPKSNELAIAIEHLRTEANPVTAVENLIWGLINTKEFILNH